MMVGSAAMPTVSSGMAQKLRALLWLCVILGMALGFLSFAIETGGLAATQAHCRQPQFAQYSYVQLPVGLSCGRMFRWLWWIWGLNTTVWHAIMFALVLQVLKPAAANGLLHLFVVATVLQMWGTNVSLDLMDALKEPGANTASNSSQITAARVMFAGFLITCFGNSLVLFALGCLSIMGFKQNSARTAAPPPVSDYPAAPPAGGGKATTGAANGQTVV